MKTLLILRHAEAAAPGAAGSDHARPLTAAGAAQARRVGETMRDRGLGFARVVCSSALRARETAEAVLSGSGARAPLDLTEALYNAAGEDMLAVLEGLPDSAAGVLLVAHMPGVAELAELISQGAVQGTVKFQPGALAEYALDIARWNAIQPGCGKLRSSIQP